MSDMVTINIKLSEKKIINLKKYEDSGAKKIHCIVQKNATLTVYDATIISDISFSLLAGSCLNYIFLCTTLVEKKIICCCDGKGSQANINGISVIDKKQNISLVTQQKHNASGTQSSLILKSILADSSYFNHQGTILVGKNLSHVKACQKSKAIVLGRYARVDSSPALEVLSKNVQCSHGSAVGHVDPQQFFYLCSRGIKEKKAKQLLLQAFLLLSSDTKIKQDFFKKVEQKLQELG